MPDPLILLYVGALLILLPLLIGTVILSLSVYIVCDKNPNVYEDQGRKVVFVKCLCICLGVVILSVLFRGSPWFILLAFLWCMICVKLLFWTSIIGAFLVTMVSLVILGVTIFLLSYLFEFLAGAQSNMS